MKNEYTNKIRCRYNTTHNLLFAYILEVFTMNERYKLNAQLALAFHPELDLAKTRQSTNILSASALRNNYSFR